MNRDDADQFRKYALQRLEILDAFAIAADRRDELIQIVGSAADAELARQQLVALFGITDVQAQAVLDLQVRRFTGRERHQIADERDEIRAEIGLA